MAIQFDTATRTTWATTLANAWTSGSMKVWSGALPPNCAAPDPSGLLATIPLPNPCFTVASGVDTLTGTWSANASASGVAACVRIYDTGGTCRGQGNVTTDFVLNNVNLTAGQAVTVTAGVITMPGA